MSKLQTALPNSEKNNFLMTMFQFFKEEKRLEWFCFGLFVILYILVSLFHEPMYDEAQAWLIARDASWRELFFEIPHYEGHPPFWHLILALFAKSGFSIDIGLRIPGALFSIATIWLILFRSPFPRMIKCLIPFTYYVFFRYSIVVRPYCVTMFGLCLVASTYKKRAEKPFLHMFALMLLCVSSAYGMAMAAGICIVWIIDIIKNIKKNYFKQFSAMAVLLAYNIGQLWLMMPMDDTNNVVFFSVSTIIYSMIYMCILGPADSMFLDTGMDARLQYYAEGIVNGGLISYVNLIVGLITILFLLYYARKYRKLLLLIIPYSLFSLFSSVVYFWYHHIGLIFLYLVFVFWCGLDEVASNEVKKMPDFLSQINYKYSKLCKQIPKIALVLSLGMSLAWSAFCVGTDLFRITWYTRDLAQGIQDVGADQNNCALQWEIVAIGPFEEPADYTDASKYRHIPSVTQFFDCLVYFDENIFYNHNGGNRNVSYNQQILAEDEKQTQMLENMAEYGYPEFIIGNSFVLDALPLEEEMPGYVPVYRFEVYKPDKFIIDYNDRYIYARQDIYAQRSDWPIKEQLTFR